jgi:hypothetical protein
MTATMTNGPAKRRQLADELDRLDNIIEGLANGLPEAVASATREGARQAVRDVIVELVSNPELRGLIAGLAPPRVVEAAPAVPPEAAAPRPGFWARAKSAAATAVGRCRAAVATATATAKTLSAVMPLRKVILAGAGVGLVVGLVAYACPHGLAAAVGGLGAACAAVAAQVGAFFRRSVTALGLRAG